MPALDFSGMLDDLSSSADSDQKPLVIPITRGANEPVKLNTDLQDRISQADAAYRQQYGKPLPITSTVRSTQKQAELYANRANSPYPVARPGTSLHETGNAVDIDSSVPEEFLNQFGLHRPVKNDPVHVELMPQASGAAADQDISNALNDVFSNIQGQQIEKPKTKTVKDVAKTVLKYNPAFAIPETIANIATGTVGQIAGGLRGLYGLATGDTAEEAARKVTETQEALTYQPRTISGKAVAEYNPLALVGKGIAWTGEKLGDFAQQEAINYGLSPEKSAAIGAAVSAATQVAPMAVGAKTTVASLNKASYTASYNAAIKAGAPPALADSIASKVGKAKAPAPTGTIISGAPAETEIPTYIRRQRGAAQAQLQQQLEQKQQTAVGQQLQTQLASAQGKPVQGATEQAAQVQEFKPLEYSETEHPLEVQKQRAQTVERVMGSDFNVDPDAIAGRGRARATSLQTSLTDTPLGNLYKNVFENEQIGLRNYSQNLIKETGGTVGLDQKSLSARGKQIIKPLQDLDTYFKAKIKQIYADRDAVAADIPVIANNVKNILNTESLTAVTPESAHLANGVLARMRELKMIDKDGNLLPTNAKTAELLRQYINDNWDRKNAGIHTELKNAVDEDVIADLPTSEPIYKDARALVKLKKDTIDNPKGISVLLEESKGNRKVDFEKVPDKIIGQGVDQFAHIVDTLKNVPEELRPQAQKALAQIKAHFLNELDSIRTKAGNVDPVKITEFLSDNNAVMEKLFTPEEMAKIKDYNDAAHIFKTDTGYKGAEVQKINVGKRLGFGQKTAEKTAQGLSAATAEKLTGGLTQGVAGGAAYEATGGIFERRRAKKAAQIERQVLEKEQKRFTPISELTKSK